MANLEFLRQEGCDPKQHIWSRRNFMGLAGWGAVLGSLNVGLLCFGRFMYPRVLFEPRTTVKIGRPDEYQINAVNEKWIKLYRFWVVRTPAGFLALSGVCTHLGCTPRYLTAENKFKCPCHGSGYYRSGINFEGPTPRPLERAAISISPDDGQIFIDKSRKFLYEKGQWTDPAAFIKTT